MFARKFMKYKNFFIAAIFGLLLFASNTWAHTFHTSLARIDYNEKEKLAEISIRLFVHDLVPVLEKRSKKYVDLEKTKEADGLLLDYLNENFVLQDKNQNVKKLVWIGKEIHTDDIIVYVEIPLEESLDGMRLQNTIFFESFAEQTNLVVARFDGGKADLMFKPGDRFKEIVKTKSKSAEEK